MRLQERADYEASATLPPRLIAAVRCEIYPLNNVRVLKYLRNRLQLGEDSTKEWYQHWVAEGLRSFKATLLREGLSGAFCLGDAVTMADICLVPR